MSFSMFESYSREIYENMYTMILSILLLLGSLIVIIGMVLPSIKSRESRAKDIFLMKSMMMLSNKLIIFSKNPVGLRLYKNIKKTLILYVFDELKLSYYSGLISYLTVFSGFSFGIWLSCFGNVWYTRLVLFIAATLLPYYVITLLGDVIRMRFNRAIPLFFDEFRGAFIRSGRIVPSIRESSLLVDRRLGIIIRRSVDGRNPIEGLTNLKEGFENIWFSIFVSMLENYKNNGGELIVQLYRLNRSITRMNNLEKKKNKRLLLYELFAIGATAVGIPVCIYINHMILGSGFDQLDVENSGVVLKVIMYCLIALVITRILRKL